MTWRWFGRVDYEKMLAWQNERRASVIAGAPDVLAMVEHPRVVTTGRRGGGELSRVRAAGIPVVQTGRGGLATWHGPGQLVGYPIVHLVRRKMKVREIVRRLEEGLIAWCQGHGVGATRDPTRPGVWVGERKLASVGIHVRRGVVMHGFSINLTCELDDFGLFTPCGLDGVRMTSMREHGCSLPPEEAAATIGNTILSSLTQDASVVKSLVFTEGA